MDGDAEFAQPTDMMSDDPVSLMLIQSRQPALRIWLAGAEYLKDQLRSICAIAIKAGALW